MKSFMKISTIIILGVVIYSTFTSNVDELAPAAKYIVYSELM